MKKIQFFSLATILVLSSVILISCQKNPEDVLAAKMVKSKNFVAMDNAVNVMQQEMSLNYKKNRKILAKYKRSTFQSLLNDKYLSSEQKTDSLAKMGIVQTPLYKEKSLEMTEAIKKLQIEFPELKSLSKSESKSLFHKANQLYKK